MSKAGLCLHRCDVLRNFKFFWKMNLVRFHWFDLSDSEDAFLYGQFFLKFLPFLFGNYLTSLGCCYILAARLFILKYRKLWYFQISFQFWKRWTPPRLRVQLEPAVVTKDSKGALVSRVMHALFFLLLHKYFF